VDFETLSYLQNCHHHHLSSLFLAVTASARRRMSGTALRPLASHAPSPHPNPPSRPWYLPKTAPWHPARLPRAPTRHAAARRRRAQPPRRCLVAAQAVLILSQVNSSFPSSPPCARSRARALPCPEMSPAPWPPSSELAVAPPLRPSADQIK